MVVGMQILIVNVGGTNENQTPPHYKNILMGLEKKINRPSSQQTLQSSSSHGLEKLFSG